MVILGKKYPYAFIHIPKTGGSSVTRYLAEIEGWSIPEGEPHAWQRPFHTGPMHDPKTSISTNRTAFCVVRDPVDRLWSWARAKGVLPQDFTRWAKKLMAKEAEGIHVKSQVPQGDYFSHLPAVRILNFQYLRPQLKAFLQPLGVGKFPEFPHCNKGRSDLPSPIINDDLWREIMFWDYAAARVMYESERLRG